MLGQFSGKRTTAEKEYRQFVGQGIGKSLWHEVRGQSILGEESLGDALVDHLRKYQDVPEIARSQRYAHRPALEKLFPEKVLNDKQKRNRKIAEAIEKYGYTQRAVADHLEMHFTYVSQIMRKQ
ncbi:MAG: hypothetical protein OEW15_05880 [Nitrospirota bacterium]|nr:hypothetical protein [Nitrospirota bacterium]